jgi:hypothetical protein
MVSESKKANRRVKDCRLLEVLQYVHIPYTQRTYVERIYMPILKNGLSPKLFFIISITLCSAIIQ